MRLRTNPKLVGEILITGDMFFQEQLAQVEVGYFSTRQSAFFFSAGKNRNIRPCQLQNVTRTSLVRVFDTNNSCVQTRTPHFLCRKLYIPNRLLACFTDQTTVSILGQMKIRCKTHTFVHYHSYNALSVRQRSEYFISFFTTFCSQDPPLDLQSPGKEGAKRGVSNNSLSWRKLGTFCCPFSRLAATDAANPSAKGDNSGVFQSFTNPYAFKKEILLFFKVRQMKYSSFF